MQAEIVWFDEIKGYGFAANPDGTKLFIHKRNFSRRNTNVVQGTKIECELRPEVDAFEEALNEGKLRDVIGKSHRNPRRILGADAKNQKKHPVAIKIRVVPHARDANCEKRRLQRS